MVMVLSLRLMSRMLKNAILHILRLFFTEKIIFRDSSHRIYFRDAFHEIQRKKLVWKNFLIAWMAGFWMQQVTALPRSQEGLPTKRVGEASASPLAA